MQKRRNGKEKAKRGFVCVRLFLCMGIICTAFYMKYTNSPTFEKLSETITRRLELERAVETISHVAEIGSEVIEVFGAEKNTEESEATVDSAPAVDAEYYTDSELNREIEEERRKAAEEEKKLSVETLSFQMSEEELYDDTEAEIFRIPPPSYCSYDKPAITFKYQAPLKGIITSKFGYRDHPIIEDASFHTGLDIAAKKGTAIAAFADGTVLESGKNATYGNYLLVEHTNGIRSFYGHNSKLNVKKGQRVKMGQKVAEVGSTGMSTGPHLHFEIRKGKIRVDPAMYIYGGSV